MIPGEAPWGACRRVQPLGRAAAPGASPHYTGPTMPFTIDLEFIGRRGVIATAALPCDGGVVLVDPGPTSCLDALTAGLASHGYGLPDVKALLLTHIHLDHAGAAGTLAAAVPGLQVYVHERGAPHLIQPEKLLASATRLYGADMDRLWGAFLAVPAANVHALDGGETLSVAGRRFAVAYTPGHAVHHVSYLDAADGMAYVGDTAGIAVDGYQLAATPPPDVDLALWLQSLDTIAAWSASALYLTHFGVVAEAATHLRRYRDVLRQSAERARTAIKAGGDEGASIEAWVRWLREDARRTLSEDRALVLEAAAPFDQIWQGLARYWRKRVEREGPAALDAPLP